MNRDTLKKVALFWLIWRLFLFVCGLIADWLVPYAPSFPYSEIMLATTNLPRWLYSWGNFDGVHYLTIAEKGYVGTGLVQAFFPMFPYILLHLPKLLLPFLPTFLMALTLSNLASFGLLIAIWLFTQKQKPKISFWDFSALIFLFPTAFFLGAVYTESLFLLFVLLTFWAARVRRWPLVGVFAMCASATRLVGICLLPALVLELYLQAREAKQHKSLEALLKFCWQPLGWITVGLIGLVGYMLFLQTEFHDMLYFLHVQTEFGGGRAESIVLYPQVAWRSLHILLTARPFDLRYFVYVQEAVIGIGGLAFILWSALKTRWSYVLFSLLAFLIPTATGTFSSIGRYFLVSFSVWVALTEFFQVHSRLKWLWLIASTILLIFNTILFIQGYWVA